MNIKFETGHIDKTAQIGPSVEIHVKHLVVGRNVVLGFEPEEETETLRTKIYGDEVIINDGTVIDSGVFIKCAKFFIGDNSSIKKGCVIRVTNNLKIGDDAKINEFSRIEGRTIKIGNSLWMGRYVTVGGGSCFDVHSSLNIGDNCHIGDYSFINTAKPVKIGNEVGLGMRTSLFTHGAYLSILEGFPATFGSIEIRDRCWLPGATVNPGVIIGPDAVVGVGSVVTGDIPPSSLAAGVPAKVIRENAYPKKFSTEESRSLVTEVVDTFAEVCSDKHKVEKKEFGLVIDRDTALVFDWLHRDANYRKKIIITDLDSDHPESTVIHLKNRTVRGHVDEVTDMLINQFRRYGIRFRRE